MKQGLTSDRIPPVFGPYCSAVAAGDMIFISGNAGFDKNQRLVGGGDVKEETRQALENIKMLLEDNDACLDDIVRTTVYLSDVALWNDFNEAYAPFFREPYPARTCVGCQLNGFLVELECTAVRGRAAGLDSLTGREKRND